MYHIAVRYLQVFFVSVQFYSPMPIAMTIERMAMNGSSWEQWQLYADDCQADFNLTNNGPLASYTAVNCIQFNT